MIFRETGLAGSFLIDVDRKTDERGYFARTWCQREFAGHGLVSEFVQHSVSFNEIRGTLRGLHFQSAPHREAKVVSCARGAIFDVIVDLRPDSATYRQCRAYELSADSHRMLYVPEDFAHGFQTLADETEVSYMISGFHVPEAARGIRYDDPALNVNWPLPISRISSADRSWPTLDGRPGHSTARSTVQNAAR
jgi:dTDP-4-dehydrorhamnose 3,5-epimerase